MIKRPQKTHNRVKTKKANDKLFKVSCQISAWTLVIIFGGLIGFIIWKSVPGFSHYGFENIILNDKFDINNNNSKEASVWLPLAITLLISFCAVLIATPLSVKTATFIKFRIRSKKIEKFSRIIIETTAGIPSVIFGLFASQALGLVITHIFRLNSNYTILTAIFMLSFMLIPTITSLTLNAYDSNDKNLINNSISLGITKTRSIYKIFRKKTRSSIFVAIVIALGRAIGETMAVSMILSNQSYSDVFQQGFGNVLTSSLSPLGSVISVGMFSENGGVQLRGLLYAFGIVMFVVVMILNIFVMIITSSKQKNYSYRTEKIKKQIWKILGFLPEQLGIIFEKITYRSKIKIDISNFDTNLSKYISKRIETNKALYLYSIYKVFWEVFCAVIVFSFVGWIALDIIISGIHAASLPTSTMFQFGMNTTGQAALNTLLLIFITIIISLPFTLLIAIYLNEFAKDRLPKKIIIFLTDSLGATPSIIFGMFGLAFFIQTVGISMSGHMGTSILAGAFTVAIVILPNFIRTIQQSLQNVPNSVRENAFALGSSKLEAVSKLVIPAAARGIVTSVLLSIGRILAETAPLYLTAGLSSSNSVAIMNPGQTLTTRIYAQLYATNATIGINIMYESALTTLILVLVLTLIGHLIIPYYKPTQSWLNYYWISLRNTLKLMPNFEVKKFKKQIYGNRLYISQSQADFYGINEKDYQALIYNKKIIKIKYVTDQELYETSIQNQQSFLKKFLLHKGISIEK